MIFFATSGFYCEGGMEEGWEGMRNGGREGWREGGIFPYKLDILHANCP